MAATSIITAGSRCARTYVDTDLWSFSNLPFHKCVGLRTNNEHFSDGLIEHVQHPSNRHWALGARGMI